MKHSDIWQQFIAYYQRQEFCLVPRSPALNPSLPIFFAISCAPPQPPAIQKQKVASRINFLFYHRFRHVDLDADVEYKEMIFDRENKHHQLLKKVLENKKVNRKAARSKIHIESIGPVCQKEEYTDATLHSNGI